MERELTKKLLFLEKISRHKALFLLLLRSDAFMTSDDLAEKLAVTSRTIKSDIKSISQCLKDSIPEIQIEARRSKGFRIVFQEKDLKNEIKEYFKIYQIHTISTDFEKRVKYIVRRLLAADSPVKVEQLQEELYINTSNYIQQEMQEVRNLLRRYGLTLRLTPKLGLEMEGDCFNKLVCLVRVCHYFDTSEPPEFDEIRFNRLFLPWFGNKELIKQIICNCLTETRIVFSDISLEKFVMFFLLLSNINVSEKDSPKKMKFMDFDYRITEEYKLVLAIDKAVEQNFPQHKRGSQVFIEFLTYMAVMNTDLYRFRDCTRENYGSLIELSEQVRDMILSEFEYTFKVRMTSETVRKDLVKVLIPISMKIKLGISDDLDLFFYNQRNNKPIITNFVDKVSSLLKEAFQYELSVREKTLILNVLYEFINGIELSHKKMKIALIAINGRLSTQQLKFCMRKSYESFIEKIDTKVLYELEKQGRLDYDYYFCPAYGKNMSIPYSPIYFFEEGVPEEEYERKLDMIFISSYDYNRLLPSVRYTKIADIYKIQAFPVKDYLHRESDYIHVLLGKKRSIALYLCFDAAFETIEIYYFDHDGVDINGVTQYIFLNLNIRGNHQKFKMILNFISNLVEKEERLSQYCSKRETDVSKFFQRY